MRTAWAGLPVRARWVLAVYMIGFTDGTGAHVRDLARAGLHAYSGFPCLPLRVFFFALVLLDPLVVLLCAFVRPAGVWLAGIVMVLDVAANTAGNWPAFHYEAMLILIVFCAFVLGTAPPLLRAIRRVRLPREAVSRPR